MNEESRKGSPGTKQEEAVGVDGPGGRGKMAHRALECALGPLREHAGQIEPLLIRPGLAAETVESLLSAVPLAPATTASVERLAVEALSSRLEVGASAIVAVESGWLVCSRRFGQSIRSYLITPGGERRVSWRAARRLLATPTVSALVLEPHLALESLSVRSLGSTSPWARLRALIRLERFELTSLVLYAVVVGALSLAVPVAVQVLVNTIAFGSLLQPLVVLALLLLSVLGVSGILQVISSYVIELMLRRLFVRTAEDFGRRLVSAPLSAHDSHYAPELVNRFFDVVGVQKAVGRLLLDGLGLVLQTVVSMALLAFYHPFLLAFDLVLIVALIVVVALGYGAVPTAKLESRAKYRVAAWLETLASHPSLFRAPAVATLGAETADTLVRDYLAARRRHYRRVLRQLVGGVAVQVFALVALLGVGGWLVMRGELTLGQLVAAELVVGVVGAGFAKLGKQLEASYDLLASLDKLGAVIDLPVERLPIASTSDRIDRVQAEQLSVTRGGSGTSRPIDVDLPRSSRVRVTGRGGTGKSALLDAFAGRRPPASGSLLINGQQDQSRQILRARSWLLRPREVILGSVLDNLRLGDPQLDEARAWQALTTVALDERVGQLDDGLHTPLRPDGGPLSESETTRLMVARAWLAAPDLLLVDRGLDGLGLDAHTTSLVLERVLGDLAPWAALVVTDDPEVAKFCSRQISLDPAERGN